ncbi:MAG: 50S ribosomal protein L6 [Elusimicrobia bacterium RIFCSPLOWO2_01_FULL_64_13]|nr:MAG: 50S ribosomal protein L6 [Elusimicrobia bacterium RIFCSPLOWO2_01_FULL_64_13]
MSRVGRKPIPIPDKVTARVLGSVIEIKGPGGTLSKAIPAELEVRVDQGTILVSPKTPASLNAPLLHGLTRTLIANMVSGLVQSWKKELELQGVGYRAAKNGQVLNLQLGFSHPINFPVPPLVQFSVDPKQTLVTLTCPDRDLLGVTAAKIRSLRPPEPYKGKGIRYLGERVVRKAGKAAGAAGAGAGAAGAKK